MSKTPVPFLSTGQLGDLLGVQAWRISRLFELGILPETSRIAGRRMIPAAMVPTIIDRLKERGWLPAEMEGAE